MYYLNGSVAFMYQWKLAGINPSISPAISVHNKTATTRRRDI